MEGRKQFKRDQCHQRQQYQTQGKLVPRKHRAQHADPMWSTIKFLTGETVCESTAQKSQCFRIKSLSCLAYFTQHYACEMNPYCHL